MIKKYCDRCNKDMGIVYSPAVFGCCATNNTTDYRVTDEESMNVWIGQYPDKMRLVDLCEGCHRKVYEFIFKPQNGAVTANEL